MRHLGPPVGWLLLALATAFFAVVADRSEKRHAVAVAAVGATASGTDMSAPRVVASQPARTPANLPADDDRGAAGVDHRDRRPADGTRRLFGTIGALFKGLRERSATVVMPVTNAPDVPAS